MRVLLVEDDDMIGRSLQQALETHGWSVDWVRDGMLAQSALADGNYACVLLDLGLPKRDGMEVLRQARTRGDATPVLVLTARDGLQDRIGGLDLGADDYMVKPFELPELLARLRALLRRSQAATSAILSFGSLELDSANRQARANGQLIELGPREWTVMEYLLIHAPKPASKEKLLAALTGWDKEITPNAIEVYISRLRGKLEPHGVALRSIRGFGYRLELVDAAPAGG